MAASQPVRTNWHPSKKHSDVERWVCIYPAYINSKKTRQEGRRLPKDVCVENPTYAEIRDVLSVTNLRVGVENKQYSRECSRELHLRGRIRVQMRNDDGTPCNPELNSREDIMRYVSTRIPQLKTRQGNAGNQQTHVQAQQSAGGKKGKGKRR
ncbi:PREDICTED: signal recognition particle 19 kDa protein isoform X2 [Rhagoletis zephyria]|uniref:signal recognition particle 19 kDa protein n=1 Tax=Rhagoletis pomonella TaxID=28610 RepID=UPI000811A2F7|nr:PREDICTED: signal recognition particle 19 kDa protein isoform X1 [Rhagoletis zephyria]XP_017480093.1 PREDICTED: signal recognition particle 19 kDa protein isoform X2 [Rhagoletis zephyria]XP_036337340.1 signal recognition particle 19 kDa protein [Rhagoletis pomonella]